MQPFRVHLARMLRIGKQPLISLASERRHHFEKNRAWVPIESRARSGVGRGIPQPDGEDSHDAGKQPSPQPDSRRQDFGIAMRAEDDAEIAFEFGAQFGFV